jgi:preprotein translocase subunit YajC
MELQPGDWVRTESGEVGTVVHTARLSVYVRLNGEPKPENVKVFLMSQLTRIDPPQEPSGPTPTFRS